MAEHPKLFIFINELRKSFRNLLVSLVLCSFAIFFVSPQLLQLVQGRLAEKLYFFTVAEPFLAHAKLAFFAALFLLMPWFTVQLWRALGKPFHITRRQLVFLIFCTCLLFYGGTIFCYTITLPLGIDFLLGYGSEELKPVISVSRFVNFVTIFVLVFGLTFELPIFMVFSVKVKVLKRDFYEKNRRFAILFIAIVSAILTPADVFTMFLMGVPLYLLYESGIIILKVLRIGREEKKNEGAEG